LHKEIELRIVKFIRIVIPRIRDLKSRKSKFQSLAKYQENIIDKEVTLSKIPEIFRDFQELLNFQELRFREFGISNRKSQKFQKLTKYQENITDEEVTLSKIPRIFRDFRELLNFQELHFREFEISNRESQSFEN